MSVRSSDSVAARRTLGRRARVLLATIATAVAILGSAASASATIVQPNGEVVPRATSEPESLEAYFAANDPTIDWRADAQDGPGTFVPVPGGTVELAYDGAGFDFRLAWYNDSPEQTKAPADEDLHTLMPVNAPVGTVVTTDTIRKDPDWDGGPVSLALLSNKGLLVAYADRRHNTVCTGCTGPDQTVAPWARAAQYFGAGGKRYLGFEDLPLGDQPSSALRSDMDFNDAFYVLRGFPGPTQCANTTDDDGDGNVDQADRGCYSGPAGSFDATDDSESPDPPAPAITLPADPIVGRDVRATITSPGTGVQECSIALDRDRDGSFETPLTTTTDAATCDATAPADLGRGEYPVRATLTETSNRSTVATGTLRILAQCENTADDDGDQRTDRADRGCYSGPGGAYAPLDDAEGDDPPAPALGVEVTGSTIVATVREAGTGIGACTISVDGRDVPTDVAPGPPTTCTASVPADVQAGSTVPVVATLTETAGGTATAATTATVASPAPEPAGPVTSPPAPAPVRPATPTPDVPPAASAPAPLPCAGRALQLTEVRLQGRRLLLAGLARPALAGQTVRLTDSDGRVAGTTTIARDGGFRALVAPPAASRRATVRYRASVAGRSSPALRLQRNFSVVGLRDGLLVAKVSGRIAPGTRVAIRRELTCRSSEPFRTIRVGRSGRIVVRLPPPPGGTPIALYRASVQPPKGATGRTFTLPIVVRGG